MKKKQFLDVTDDFWDTDLPDIQDSYLPEGKKIVDFPTQLDRVVPPQGSVLLGHVKKYDD